MQNKTVVITGATSGIGQVTARSLAQRGARIVQVARDRERAAAALAELKGISPEAGHRVYFADLSRIEEMKRVAQEIAADVPRIDVLVNNAGMLSSQRQVTADGLEKTFATNHLAYFVLTQLLRDPLLAAVAEAGSARVVNTASRAHIRLPLLWDDLQHEKSYSGFPVYCRSKLCNVLFTRELARRTQGTGLQAYCHHPGVVSTRLALRTGGWLEPIARFVLWRGISAEQGAQTMIHLASADPVNGPSGGYFDRSKPIAPHPRGQSDADALRLWELSSQITGVNAWPAPGRDSTQ